jgi:hypothetical protein
VDENGKVIMATIRTVTISFKSLALFFSMVILCTL